MLVLGAIFGVGSLSCSDITHPEREPEAGGWSVGPGSLVPLSYYQNGDSAFCANTAGCNFHVIDATETCKCEIQGITAAVDSGQGEPPPSPPEPQPPGYPPEDWMSWPTPPGAGGPPPPYGEPLCDPQSFLNPCETYTASLSCPLNVHRGDPGACTFDIEPASALDLIIGWVFNGDGPASLSVSDWQHDEVTWEGRLVTSGKVTVHFQALGRVGKRTAPLGVRPRTGSAWKWSEGDGISYDAGGLLNPPTPWPANRVAIICHPIQGCATSGGVPQDKYFVQPQNPVHGDGFIRSVVSDGPNEGLWYLESVGVEVKTASAFNPDPASRPDAVAS